MPLPPYQFDDLRCLIEVVRLGSLSAAARVLRLSVATVSRRLSRLEDELGLHLLNRNARGLTPTDDAEALVASSATLLDEVAENVAEVIAHDTSLTGALRVSAPMTAAEDFLARWLAEFAAAHPGLTLDLIATDQSLDLISAGVDIAFRVGQLVDSDLRAQVMCKIPYVLAVAGERHNQVSGMLAAEGWTGLEDMAAVVAPPLLRWGCYNADGQLIWVTPRPVFQVNNPIAAAQAVAAGLGVGYLPLPIARRAGLATIHLDEFGLTARARTMRAVTPKGQLRRRKVTALIEAMRARFATDGEAHGLVLPGQSKSPRGRARGAETRASGKRTSTGTGTETKIPQSAAPTQKRPSRARGVHRAREPGA